MIAFLKRYFWGIGSGIILALCFPTWHLFALAWLALTPLFHRALRVGAREAAAQFFLAGLVFNLVLLQWLLSNIYWAGGWAFWGHLILSSILALFWAIVGMALVWLRKRCPWLPAPLAIAVLWMAMEYLHATLFTGFGWGSLAYSQGKDLPFLQLAAIGGAPLVSAVLVGVNMLVAQAIGEPKRRWPRVLAVVVVVGGAHGAGWSLLDDAEYASPPFSAGIIQSDFPLEMKWDDEYSFEMVRNAALKSRMLAKVQPIDLFVWPESLIMDDVDTPGFTEELAALTRDTGAALYTGAHRAQEETGGALNSSYLIDSEGTIADYYDKRHLAPFGEYVPFSDYFPFISKVVPAIGAIRPGTRSKPMRVAGRTFGPLICFEVLFAPLAEQYRREGADMLVVITNLGWFGASNAIPQELEIARVRAIETRLPLVHSANTGISGTFDPWGRFAGLDRYFPGDGSMYSVKGIPPADTIMHRLAGATPVALPGPRPVPHGPRVIPPASVAAVLLLVAVGAFRRGKVSQEQ